MKGSSEAQEFITRMVEQGRAALESGMPLAHAGYAVVIVSPAEAVDRAVLREFLTRRADIGISASRPLACPEGFIMVVADREASRIERTMEDWQQDFFWQYRGDIGIGIGRSRLMTELDASLLEAKIALLFRAVTGKRAFVQNYIRMGLFTGLFSEGLAAVEEFTRATIGVLEDYDASYHTTLVATLRALLENDFNWKQTAAEMFVHVNTLRYRYEKIQQVLGCEVAGMELRTNLFAAVRAGEIIRALNGESRQVTITPVAANA